jgi:hypothetical protein
MHAHTHLSHKHTYTYINRYVYNAYIYIYIRIYAYNHTSRLSYAQPCLTHVDTRACACPHVCAHPRARTTARTASTTRPSASRQAARRPGRIGGAYHVQRGDRGGVPRADVSVERRRRLERLRAEPNAVHADGTRSHASSSDAWAPTHAPTRARTSAQHVRASGARARIGDPILQCARIQLRAFIVSLNATCVCSIDLAS